MHLIQFNKYFQITYYMKIQNAFVFSLTDSWDNFSYLCFRFIIEKMKCNKLIDQIFLTLLSQYLKSVIDSLINNMLHF